jgi:hypothetical protein
MSLGYHNLCSQYGITSRLSHSFMILLSASDGRSSLDTARLIMSAGKQRLFGVRYPSV